MNYTYRYRIIIQLTNKSSYSDISQLIVSTFHRRYISDKDLSIHQNRRTTNNRRLDIIEWWITYSTCHTNHKMVDSSIVGGETIMISIFQSRIRGLSTIEILDLGKKEVSRPMNGDWMKEIIIRSLFLHPSRCHSLFLD